MFRRLALSSVRVALGVATLLLGATWAWYAVQDSALDNRIRTDLTVRAERLDSAYATDVSAEIAYVSSVLHFVAAIDAADGPNEAAQLVRENGLNRGNAGNMAIVGLSGRGFYVGPKGIAPIDISSRPFFHAASNDLTGSLTIGSPVTGKISGIVGIPFAVPVRRHDGRIVGVVSTIVDSATFTAAYDENDIGKNGSLLMIATTRPIVLSRYTISSRTGGQAVRDNVMSLFTKSNQGSFWQQSTFDGVLRDFAYRKLPGIPIIVVGGLAYVDAAPRINDIRRNNLLAAGVASFIILIVLLAWLRQIFSSRLLLNAKLQAETAEAEARRANQAKSEFLANMSHEIRTPLNGVIGLTYLVLQTELSEKQRTDLGKIKDSAARLLAILNDILDVSKIEAGRIELEDVNFDLGSVLTTVKDVASVQAEQKRIGLRIERDPDVPTDLRGDPLRIGQVLINIIGNAIKFTDRGEVALRVSRLEDPAGERLRFEIRDTGIGMDQAQLGHIFESFSQADTSITRRFGGTGLGLTISKTFVNLMGGNIEVESTPGAGTTFRVTIPLKVSRVASRGAERKLLAGLRVLVVDDDSTDRDRIREILSEWSMEVQAATSVRAAYAALKHAISRRRDFDVVILDWKMPNIDGIEAARTIKSWKLVPPPLMILVTAHGREHLLHGAETAGIDAVLVKPLDPSLLLDTIATGVGALPPPKPTGASTTTQSLAGIRILVAEDNAINQEIVGALLTDAGATVESASNGALAVKRVCEDAAQFDVLLMDVQMPEMDGLTATWRIRERFDAEHLPIIAMTAHALESERRRCLGAGMNDHISKPIDPVTLLETVARWCRRDYVEAPESPAASESSSLAAALPSFDISAALRRCLNDEEFLRRMLMEFLAQYELAASKIRDLIGAGDVDEAAKLAHSLAGVAGQIGAGDVHEKAQSLKLALRERHSDGISALLDDLTATLDDVMEALRRLRGENLTLARESETVRPLR